MTERDLDLILLEELSADTGFLSWFGEQNGLQDCGLISCEHSVSAKAGAKWGETDVLAIVRSGSERIAVLIEDKIAAQFTDRQAERYQERAAELVKAGQADRSMTVLCAPQSYLAGVPRNDPWDRTISIESLLDWYDQAQGFRAEWRAAALRGCLARLSRSSSAGSETIQRFSEELHGYLVSLDEGFEHTLTGDNWGFIIKSDRTPAHVQLAWKNTRGRVDLSFSSYNLGKAKHITAPDGVDYQDAKDAGRKTDTFSIDVPVADVTLSLDQQIDVVSEVMDAARNLLPLVPKVLQVP